VSPITWFAEKKKKKRGIRETRKVTGSEEWTQAIRGHCANDRLKETAKKLAKGGEGEISRLWGLDNLPNQVNRSETNAKGEEDRMGPETGTPRGFREKTRGRP